MEGDIDYWKNKYAVCNEAFAHFFETSMGSPERLKYIKLVFPNGIRLISENDCTIRFKRKRCRLPA